MDSSVLNKHSEILLVRYEDGVLVSDSLHTSALMDDDRPKSLEDLGLINIDGFRSFREVVDFDEAWTPEQADKAFKAAAKAGKKGLLTVYPIPIIPEEYDPAYRPKFFVVNSIAYGVFGVVDDITESIDADVQRLCILAGGLAVFGMVLVLAIVWCVSRMLTQPLLWIESIAWRIVNHSNQQSGDWLTLKMAEKDKDRRATMLCAPKTEVNELVSEFRTMIKGFSGDGACKVADSALHEVKNVLTWHSDFQQLYSSSRDKKKTPRSTSVGSDTTGEDSGNLSADRQRGILNRPLNQKTKMLENGIEEIASTSIVPAPVKRNRSNVIRSSGDAGRTDASHKSTPIRIHRSPLFWWIVILIVIPLLLLIGVICAIVSHDIVSILPTWVQQADEASEELALQSLRLTAASKASLMTAVVFEPIRDLHVVTRVAGWLYFGGIKLSPAFTVMDSASEECKVYQLGTCPFYDDPIRTPCACDWDDPHGKTCSKFNETESRNLQKGFWGLQSQDVDPTSGRRYVSSSFPAVGSSPETTQWFSNASALPGFEEGEQSSGYSTSYERLRVASAMSIVNFPVYNYAASLGWNNRILGVYAGLEEDGLFTGFNGCAYTHADFAFWETTTENRAALVNSYLCPIGKFGYDPRCRDWYRSGKTKHVAALTPVHITAPYQFAIEDEIATSATSPIANPTTGEYLGQTLLDFNPDAVKSGLEHLEAIVSILITPNVDVLGGDTVVGPNKSAEWESASILDLLFQFDAPSTLYRTQFEQDCLLLMKDGASGLSNFSRTSREGSLEHLVIAYAPVFERVLLPTSPDDFSSGVESRKVLLYSVGIVRNVEDIHAPFNAIADDIEIQLDSIRTIYVVVTAIVALVFTAFTCMVSLRSFC